MTTRVGHDGPDDQPGDAPAVARAPDEVPGDPAARLLAIAWAAFQPRTVQLAAELGGESVFISSPRLARSGALLPLRYISGAIRTWCVLERHRPRRVLVITPPVVAPLVCLLWAI